MGRHAGPAGHEHRLDREDAALTSGPEIEIDGERRQRALPTRDDEIDEVGSLRTDTTRKIGGRDWHLEPVERVEREIERPQWQTDHGYSASEGGGGAGGGGGGRTGGGPVTMVPPLATMSSSMSA